MSQRQAVQQPQQDMDLQLVQVKQALVGQQQELTWGVQQHVQGIQRHLHSLRAPKFGTACARQLQLTAPSGAVQHCACISWRPLVPNSFGCPMAHEDAQREEANSAFAARLRGSQACPSWRGQGLCKLILYLEI